MFFSYACTMYMHIEQHVILFMKICMKLYTIRLQTFLRPFLMWNNYHQFWHLSWQEMQCVAGSSRSYERVKTSHFWALKNKFAIPTKKKMKFSRKHFFSRRTSIFTQHAMSLMLRIYWLVKPFCEIQMGKSLISKWKQMDIFQTFWQDHKKTADKSN